MRLPEAAVIDSTALLALGSGNRAMSWIITAASRGEGLLVYAPALCISAAVAARRDLGEHIGSLLAIHVTELAFAEAEAVGALIATGMDWRHAHAVVAARPNAEWPTGLAIMTVAPEAYDGQGVRVMAIPT
jgi:hypothetical protein